MISCGRCCDRFRIGDCEGSSSKRDELCLRLRVFFASGFCVNSVPAFPTSSTTTVTSTLSSQASMDLMDSQEIVLREREGEERVAVLNGSEASFGL